MSALVPMALGALSFLVPSTQELAVAGAASAAPPPVLASFDRWSDPIAWRTADGWHAVAVHASLLSDGRVACVGYARNHADPALATETRKSGFVFTPTPLGALVPPETLVTEVPEPVDIEGAVLGPYFVFDDLFCSGNTLLADGSVLTVGGTRAWWNPFTLEVAATGLSYATRFDGTTWERLPGDMLVAAGLGTPARWYPACTRLFGGEVLVTGGNDLILPYASPNLSVEVYDPLAGAWSIVSGLAETPAEIHNPDYSHPVLLPVPIRGFDLVVLGASSQPAYLSLAGPERWYVAPSPRPLTQPGQQPNVGATTALLPLRTSDGEWGYANGSLLVAGGEHHTSHIASADVFDPTELAWSRRALGVARHHPTAVLLPDGRVLVVAGAGDEPDERVQHASYLDPAHDLRLAFGTSASDEVRGYHSIALLLPDGRVLVGGGQGPIPEGGTERSDFRYLWPSYLFAERPRILHAPALLSYGSGALLASSGPRPVEAVLMSLGSMTHSFDFNQRSIQLALGEVQSLGETLHLVPLVAPADGRVAPPGSYMLFLLDAERIPSVAAIVRVE